MRMSVPLRDILAVTVTTCCLLLGDGILGQGVPRLPRFLLQRDGAQYGPECAILNCSAHSNPPPRYQYAHDGRETDFSQPEYDLVQVLPDHSLRVCNYTAFSGRTGLYECIASNINGLSRRRFSLKPIEAHEYPCPAPKASGLTLIPQLRAYAIGAILELQCPDGHRLTGSSMRTCQRDGSWTGGPPPECIRVVCPPPEQVRYSTVKTVSENAGSGVTETYSAGTVVEYTCVNSTQLVGQSRHQCQEGGRWTGALPRCAGCPDPGEPENGMRTFPRSPTISFPDTSAAVFECNPGYVRTQGALTQYCVAGEWTDEPVVCSRRGTVTCALPTAPANGFFFPSKPSYVTGEYVQYRCGTGYQPRGASGSRCLESGSWQNAVHQCEAVQCRPLASPINGFLVGGNLYGSVAQFSCNEASGYSLVGSKSSTCGADGQWSWPPPKCVQSRCSQLLDPTNGFVTTLGLSGGNYAYYRCRAGFQLNGERVVRCLASGTWNNDPPTCSDLSAVDECALGTHLCPSNTQCQDTPNAYECPCMNGFRLSIQTFTCQDEDECAKDSSLCPGATCVNTEGSYQCNCGRRFSWENGSCVAISCETLPDIAHGSTDSGDLSYRTTAQFSCETGYELVGNSEDVICERDGTWHGQIPTCEVVKCPDLPATIPFGTINDTKVNYEYGDVISYQCRLGYLLERTSTVRCTATGVWEPAARLPARCVLVRCGPVNPIANGRVRVLGNSFRKRAEFLCNVGYRRVGATGLTCGPDGEWIGRPPRCDRDESSTTVSVCPSIAADPNGRRAVTGTHVGAIATLFCNTGYRRQGPYIRRCEAAGWSGNDQYCLGPGTRKCLPVQLENSMTIIVQGDGVSPGSVLRVSCDSGYELDGETDSTRCLSTGGWSLPLPACIASREPEPQVDCPVLPDIANGRIAYTGTSDSRTAEYTCNSGYTLCGNAERQCDAAREWSGEDPVCRLDPLDSTVDILPFNELQQCQGASCHDKLLAACGSGCQSSGIERVLCFGESYFRSSFRSETCTTSGQAAARSVVESAGEYRRTQVPTKRNRRRGREEVGEEPTASNGFDMALYIEHLKARVTSLENEKLALQNKLGKSRQHAAKLKKKLNAHPTC